MKAVIVFLQDDLDDEELIMEQPEEFQKALYDLKQSMEPEAGYEAQANGFQTIQV